MSLRFSNLLVVAVLLVAVLFTNVIEAQEDDHLSSPEAFNRHLTRLSPRLIEATVAVMVPPGSGSGVIVSPEGLVMTAAHVTVEPGKSISVILSDGRRFPATALGVDHSTDGALLQINSAGPFPFRPYVQEKTYEKGDWVIATGHPGGPIKNRRSPVRLGRILADGTKSGFTDPITSSATIISGDSGGPLFNLDGEVIGINSNIGRNYLRNNHVPVPCMLEQMKRLLIGETIGKRPRQAGGGSRALDPGLSFFDEPYADLRERFIELLPQQKSDPEAMALLAQPRLLDPHHMQEKLDLWYPSGNLPPRPKSSDEKGEEESEQEQAEPEPRKQRAWIGVVPELLVSGSVKIKSVEAGSPADKAGLEPGDEIVQFNNNPITSIADLSSQLAQSDLNKPINLVLSDDRKIKVLPASRFERKLFPAPVAGLIQMRVVDDGGEKPDDITNNFLSEVAKTIGQDHADSVVAIKHEDKTVSLATVVSSEGELLAKASELAEISDSLTSRQGAVELLAVDKESDLALLKTSPSGLKPITWKVGNPRVASLVFTTGDERSLVGVVTQRMRINPSTGFENSQSSDAPSVWLGAIFIQGSLEPVVGRVELSSPADVAGVLEGDLITDIQGKKVESIAELNSELKNYLVGDKVELTIDRSGDTKSIDLILAKVPDDLAIYSKAAAARDQNLAATSRWGGALNERRNDFPKCIYHDIIIRPEECGSPLFDLEGNAIGINIARSFRHRSLALPASEVLTRIDRLRRRVEN